MAGFWHIFRGMIAGEMAEKPRILVVDDEEEIRQLLQVTLEDDGFAVELAADGNQGLAKLQSFKPHLVLLDLVMPNLDGKGFLKWLSDRGLRSGVVIVTAYWESVNKSELSKDRNVVDVWSKPLRYEELKKSILGLLLKHRLMPDGSLSDLL